MFFTPHFEQKLEKGKGKMSKRKSRREKERERERSAVSKPTPRAHKITLSET